MAFEKSSEGECCNDLSSANPKCGLWMIGVDFDLGVLEFEGIMIPKKCWICISISATLYVVVLRKITPQTRKYHHRLDQLRCQ